MTPDPDARRRALEQILVNGIGAPPAVRLQPADLTPLAPARLEQPQEGIATTYQPEEDEEARLRAQADEAVRFANLGEVSSRAIEGLTGARGADIWTPMRQRADEPLKAFLALQQKKTAAPAARPPASPQLSRDPASPESKRAQQVAAPALGKLYTPEQISELSEHDIYNPRGAITAGGAALSRGIQESAEAGRNERFTAEQLQQAKQFVAREGRLWEELDARERLAKLKEARDSETRGVKEVSDLRKEFESHQSVKEFRSSKVSIDKLRSAAKDPSAAGDLALIFSFMKILDPGSVVKETEFANAQNAAGVPDRVRNAWNKALSGERLNPAQRADFVRSAERLFGAHEAAYNELASQYEGLAPEGAAQRVVLPTKTPTRVPPSKGLPTGPDGKPTLDVPTKEAKKYSKKNDTTYVFDASGQVIRAEKGDTRGRAAP